MAMEASHIHHIPLEDIDDSDRLRAVDAVYVAAIATNVSGFGRLMQPIEVRPVEGGYRLVSGAHRLAAVRSLEWKTVPAFVMEVGDDEARLREIDENLVRHDLNALDRAILLHRLKVLYEKRHPETKNGAHGGRGGKRKATDTMRFSKNASENTGLSVAAIERSVRIATLLAPDVKAMVLGTHLARDQSKLLALVKLPPDEQRAVAKELLSPATRAKGVSEAHRMVFGGSQVKDKDDDGDFGKLVSAWGRSSAAVKARFLDELEASGDMSRYLPIAPDGSKPPRKRRKTVH